MKIKSPLNFKNDPYSETLDDPTVPFAVRWKLLNELDKSNQNFGLYSRFLREWHHWIKSSIEKGKTISILEVGSGSGGLSLEILKWGQKTGILTELNLYDSQEDILEESLKKFDGYQIPKTHLSTPDQLRVFASESFDYIISLHVIHHIQPFETAVMALIEMMRVAKKGIFVMDVENKLMALPSTYFFTFLGGISKELTEDAIKSVKRSHDLKNILMELNKSEIFKKYQIIAKSNLITPYWSLKAQRL